MQLTVRARCRLFHQRDILRCMSLFKRSKAPKSPCVRVCEMGSTERTNKRGKKYCDKRLPSGARRFGRKVCLTDKSGGPDTPATPAAAAAAAAAAPPEAAPPAQAPVQINVVCEGLSEAVERQGAQ